MTLGRYIGLQHIRKSASQVKNCGLPPLKGSFFKPNLKDPFYPVKQTKSHISVISHLIKMRFGVPKHLGQLLTCTESHQVQQRIGRDIVLCLLLYRLHLHRRGNMTFLDISVQNSVFLVTTPQFFFMGGQMDGWRSQRNRFDPTKNLKFLEKKCLDFWSFLVEKTQVQFSPNWYELGPPILLYFWQVL